MKPLTQPPANTTQVLPNSGDCLIPASPANPGDCQIPASTAHPGNGQIPANAVLLGSDPDSACGDWHRRQRFAESGSDPNITAFRRRWYRRDSCLRLSNKGCSRFSSISPTASECAQQATLPAPTRRIGVRAQFGDAPVTFAKAIMPNWDPTPNLLATVATLALVTSGCCKSTAYAMSLAQTNPGDRNSTAPTIGLAQTDSSGSQIPANAANPGNGQIPANPVLLGSDPDSACGDWHRRQRFAESGSDPNSTALRCRYYKTNRCQRFLYKGYSLFCCISPSSRGQRFAASGAAPNSAALSHRWYRTSSCQRLFNKPCSLFYRMKKPTHPKPASPLLALIDIVCKP